MLQVVVMVRRWHPRAFRPVGVPEPKLPVTDVKRRMGVHVPTMFLMIEPELVATYIDHVTKAHRRIPYRLVLRPEQWRQDFPALSLLAKAGN